jgi:hypothetical protein
MASWAASPAGSGAPRGSAAARRISFSHGQLPDPAPGLPQRPIIGRPVWPLTLQGVLAALQDVVAPGGQPVRLHPELARQHLQRLAAQQPQHRLQLLARRPPGPGPVVTSLLVLGLVVTAMTGIITPAYPVSKRTGSDGQDRSLLVTARTL